jgi:hypothetical protein
LSHRVGWKIHQNTAAIRGLNASRMRKRHMCVRPRAPAP